MQALLFLRTNWRLIGLGAIIVALAVQTWRMDSWRDLARARLDTINGIAAVQKQQNERIATWAKDIERKAKEIADNADRNHQAAQAAAGAAAERYIAAHRVQPADRGCPVTVAAPAEDRGPQSGDRPGADAELVAVTADDIRICTANTQRLIDARTWALELAR